MEFRSAPAQNARPSPRIIRHRISSFVATSATADTAVPNSSGLKALSFSGRRSVSQATWPSRSRVASGSAKLHLVESHGDTSVILPLRIDRAPLQTVYLGDRGGVAQRESIAFATQGSGVRIPSPPPRHLDQPPRPRG